VWLIVLLSAAMFASLDVLNKIFIGKESFWAMIFYTAFPTTLISTMVWAARHLCHIRVPTCGHSHQMSWMKGPGITHNVIRSLLQHGVSGVCNIPPGWMWVALVPGDAHAAPAGPACAAGGRRQPAAVLSAQVFLVGGRIRAGTL